MIGVIYGLYDPRTGALRYIGQTCQTLQRRLSLHIWAARNVRRHRHVTSWVKSLLSLGLQPTISTLETTAAPENLDRMEMEAIERAFARNERLTNHTLGGQGARGRKLSPEHKARLHSKEARAKMAATRKGQRSPRKGVTLSEETRAKISQGKRGNKCRFRADAPTVEMATLRSQGLPFHEIGRRLGVSKTTVANRLRGAT